MIGNILNFSRIIVAAYDEHYSHCLILSNGRGNEHFNKSDLMRYVSIDNDDCVFEANMSSLIAFHHAMSVLHLSRRS